MLSPRNIFLRNYPHLEEDEYLRADFRDTRLLSVAFSLISAISFFAILIIFRYTSDIFDLIISSSSIILMIVTFILSYRYKLRWSFILYKVLEGVFLASTSIFFKIKFYDWFETNEGFLFISASSAIVVSGFVVSIFYLLFGMGIRNFYFMYFSSFLFLIIISLGIFLYISKIVYGFTFINNFLVVIPILIYFLFISIMYAEESIKIINNGCKKHYTWAISFATTLAFPYSFIELINIFRYNSRK